ncbi:MAG TPA: trigger factor [Rhizomicrobium sp.]|nr:trigger factor [Rhizomicrobium sp.]
MQITETVSEGLRREYRIVVPMGDLDRKVTARLEEMQPRMHLKGFRPGKAPVSFLKKQFGKSMMGEIVEEAVNEGSKKAIEDNALKPAFRPLVEPVGEIEQVVEGKADLEFTVKVDLMPEFELTDVSKIEVERLYAEVTDGDVDEAMRRLAEQARTYSPRPEGSAAELDDTVEIDFVGRVNGVEFDGGRASDFNLTLGSGQFIAGFEEQLIGAKAGDAREVTVTFPQDYPEAQLAGKEASFAVTIKQVKAPDPIKIDDDFAKRLGVESLGQLKERVREQVKADFNRASRLHLKRRILDSLDAGHAFAVPPAMVDSEFEGIWNAVQAELKREGKTAQDEGKSEDDLRKEYRAIAERRIRLGLILARIGEQNGLDVSSDELQRAIAQRARQYPGQEQQVFEYYSRNAQAQAEIRAPLFEDKVVDFIAELADVVERKVDRETLFMDPDAAAEKLKSA